MSKCTKGKFEVAQKTKIWCRGKKIADVYPWDNLEEAEANAKELVRRWNAFEEGGLVEELQNGIEIRVKRLEAALAKT